MLNIWGLHVLCMIFIKTETPKESADVVLLNRGGSKKIKCVQAAVTNWAFLRAVLLFRFNSMIFSPEMGSVILNILMEFNFSLASC